MIARTFLGLMIAIAMVSGSVAQDNKTSDSDGLLPQPNSRLTANSPSQLPNGCTFNISIQKVTEFVDSQIAEYAKRSETVLADVQEIKDRMQRPDVIVPGVPEGELLSKRDIGRLEDLWRKLASITAEKKRGE